jgi:hypothetical protein
MWTMTGWLRVLLSGAYEDGVDSIADPDLARPMHPQR